jgi:hypothetical protein
MGQSQLYKEYRQDEPWDSENNMRVLAKMPNVFRSPRDRRDSTNTSYFTFVGPETMFGTRYGPRMANITDGTSNTILVVESKREVPWTKPEEIEFDSKKPVPPLGDWHPGGFCLVMCDGSARFIPDSIDQQMLKYLIMNADGHPVEIPESR